MIRRLAVTVAATPLIIVVAAYRRGYLAPMLFGCKQWCRARPGLSDRELEVVA